MLTATDLEQIEALIAQRIAEREERLSDGIMRKVQEGVEAALTARIWESPSPASH